MEISPALSGRMKRVNAILKALYGLCPTDGFSYDQTRDYPRRFLSRFNERHLDSRSAVAKTWWTLDQSDISEIEELLGKEVLINSEVSITSYIGRSGQTWDVPLDQKTCLNNFEIRHGLNSEEKAVLQSVDTTQAALTILKEQTERSSAQEALMQALEKFKDGSAIFAVIDLLYEHTPKFFYTSHFERMSGEVSLDKLAKDKQNNTVSTGDRIFLDFLEYAGTTIEELRDAERYEDLVAQCEGASNEITDEIF